MELEYKHFRNKDDFHKWLQENHENSNGIWMVFYKKHTSTMCIDYNDALEEALCFGWIDSIIKKRDINTYVRKFTPRKENSNWSEINLAKVNNLIKSGRMKEAGLKKHGIYLKTVAVNKKKVIPEQMINDSIIPDFILIKFSQNEPALMNFNALSNSCKQEYIRWICNAMKTKTIQKRLDESVALLKRKQNLGLK